MNRKYLLMIAAVASIGALLFYLFGRSSTDDAKEADKATTSSQVAPGAKSRSVSLQSLAKSSIAGQVVDENGAAIAGARVCARASSPKLASEDSHEQNCILAGTDGHYQFPGLIPARYSVSASIRGFVAASYSYERDDETKYSFALAAKEDRDKVDIVLIKGGVEVKGIVKDISGGVVSGAWVSVRKGWSFRFGSNESSNSPAVTMSGEDGSFQLWVPEGSIRATSKASGYADGSAGGIAPGQFIEIIMTPESVLAGRVVEATTGDPVPDATVEAAGAGWFGGDDSARTDANGNFRITRLSPGRYKPTADGKGAYGEAEESVLLGLGQTQEDIVIRVHPAYMVSGKVLIDESDTPCEEAHVSIEDSTGQRSKWASYDEDTGLVEFKAVLPGTYKVNVGCSGYVSQDEYPEIEVTKSDQAGLVWKVKSGEKFVGRVVTSSGEPIADANLWAQMVSGDPRGQRTSGNGRSEKDGKFVVKGILAGEYTVRARSDGYLSPEEPPKVVVEEGQVPELEIVLTDGGSLKGVVVDEKGEPVKAASVRARSLTGGRRGGGRADTLDDGTFEIEVLKAGRYRVSAGKGMWGREALLGVGKGDDDVNGEEVTIALGKTSDVRLVVQSQNGSISGSVVDEEGKPVSDAFVDSRRQSEAAGASKSQGRRRMRWKQEWGAELELTDVDGRFTLDGLADGTYTIIAYRKGGGEAIMEDVKIGGDATLTIRSTGSLAGVVALNGGGFPSEFSVSIKDSKSGVSRDESFYRTEGKWTLNDLPAGTYSVQVQAAEGTGQVKDIEVIEGQEKTGVAVSLDARATVTGTLISLDSKEPVPGMRVSVSPLSGGGFSFSSGGDKERISDEQGKFTIEDAPAGRVTVAAFPVDFVGSDYSFMRFVAKVEAGKSNDLGDLTIPKKRLKRREQAGDLGFTVHEQDAAIEPEDAEMKVALVRPKGPATDSGLAAGDIIVAIDGHDVTGVKSFLYRTLSRVKPGVTLSLTLERGDTVKIIVAQPL